MYHTEHNGIKVKINSKKNTTKHTNTWRLNDSLLNDESDKEKIKKDIEKLLEIKENVAKWKFCDTLKVFWWGKCLVLSVYIKKSGRA